MKVLAVLSQKGGVGKTTIATCLAVAAQAEGKKTAIFDLDPQATASFWKDVREDEEPAVVSIQAVRLPAMIKAADEAGTDLVIIDGAAVARDIVFDAARASDFVLIPTKAAVFDSKSMAQTAGIVSQEGTPLAVVLNFVPPSGVETDDAKDVAEQLGVSVCPVHLGHRKAFFRAQGAGLAVQEFKPGSKAAEEVMKLYEYTCIQLFASKGGDNGEAERATSSAR